MSYRFVRRLAEGGFSEVFLVEDPASALPERLVLKRLTEDMSARPEVRRAFAAEAEILRELRHANVVTFRRCYFDDARRVCLLMEEVAGETLDAWARRHAGDPDRVLDVFGDLLAAVDYLHHRPNPYLHLDLKPANVLVTQRGGVARPVLIDFGIARRSSGPGLRAYTPPYAAPEQHAGGRLGETADVHALGQILAELSELLDLPEDRRDRLIQVAGCARHRSPRRRYADAGQMGLAFRQARRVASSGAASRGVAIERARSFTGSGVARWAAACVALLLLLAWGFSPGTGSVDGAAETARFDELRQAIVEAAADEDYRRADELWTRAHRLSAELGSESSAHEERRRALESLKRRINEAQVLGPGGAEARLLLQRDARRVWRETGDEP